MKKGVYTLLITPYQDDLSLDLEGLQKLVGLQIEAGVDGIAPLGVTGETSLLTEDEIAAVLKTVVSAAKGKAKIVPDTCTSSFREAKERVQLYADLGADYISVYTPFFVLPKVDGVMKFYEELADFSPVPLLIHNSQGRTGINIAPETTAHLAKHPNIVGIKDGNKNLDHLAKVIYLTRNEDFEVFTGKDTTAFPLVCFGGAGSFSVAGNVVPQVMKNMMDSALQGQITEAEKLHFEYYDLFEALRFETNPMAAKMALHLMGLPAGNLRAPLTPLSEAKTRILKGILKKRKLAT